MIVIIIIIVFIIEGMLQEIGKNPKWFVTLSDSEFQDVSNPKLFVFPFQEVHNPKWFIILRSSYP